MKLIVETGATLNEADLDRGCLAAVGTPHLAVSGVGFRV